MIIRQDNDSLYITADTLFSARLTDLAELREARRKEALKQDSLKVEKTTDSLGPLKPADSIQVNNRSDSLVQIVPGENLIKENKSDSLANRKPADSITVNLNPISMAPARDTLVRDTIRGTRVISLNTKDSTNRYLEAYHHVRIFSDSLQAVCDSLFYSFKDSVFQLYQDPVVWAKESQITGDTLLLFTKNKKADRLKAHDNSFLVNRIEPGVYNQVKSIRLDGWFTNGDIDSVRSAGDAACIYFIQDEDSAYTGINESKAEVLDTYFQKKELYKVVFRTQVSGTIWPIRQKQPSEMRLPGFRWLDDRRPKTKYDLF